jgi:hypothetical protein
VTGHANLVCRRCGYTNVPGDTFCGSCGAFLEWEGEQAPGSGGTGTGPGAGAGTQAGLGAGGEGGAAGSGAAGGGAGAASGGAAAGTGGAVSGGAGPGARGGATATGAAAGGSATGGVGTGATPGGGDLVRCAACGVANAASRTFCQACGARLADAARIGGVSQDQIVAAVNATNRPVTVTTTTIRRPEPDEGRGAGSVAKWIAIMAVLGLAVGVAIVLGGNLLRGEGPASAASAVPSVSAAADGSGGPGPSAGPASEEPSGSPTERPRPRPLTLTGATPSSVVGNRDKFSADKAIDGDPETCWQEGVATERGEWIEIEFAPSTVTALEIVNGYTASRALYRGNHRLKAIDVSVDGGEPTRVRLDDTGDPQRVNLPDVDGATRVRITIVSVYPSVQTSVHGTPFDDAALGEVVVLGVPGS